MRLQLVSDLHLEFSDITIENTGSDMLILSGDICVAEYLKTAGEKGERFREFFHRVGREFERVLYVLGNHEHYRGHFQSTADIIRSRLPYNITLLDNEYVDIDGYRFIGGTLWFGETDPLKLMQIEDGLNDFRLVRQGDDYRRLKPSFCVGEHIKFLKFIEENKTDNTIVIGHHAPSYESVSEDYRAGRYAYLNPAYCTSLEPFIYNNPEIKLWTHGHVHSSHDYTIDRTRIVANPRGYNTENRSFNPGLILEI